MEKRTRILLLEDEPLLRGMLALTLAAQGWQVLTASSLEDGEIVLRAMGWEWPDLVLSDANLSRDPDLLDGYIFHARWRVRFPVPPFVFLHGHAHPVRLPGEDCCVVRHVPKPFVPSELIALIRAMLITDGGNG
jgi:DNA-binding response OmpR family regulator